MGIVVFFISYYFINLYNTNEFNYYLFSLITVTVVAFFKEVNDLIIKKSKFDKYDLISTIAGGVSASVVSLIFNLIFY